jgi:hypothetical protein
MGNFFIAQMKCKGSPTPSLQLIPLVSTPHIASSEIEIISSGLVAKPDMARGSVAEVTVFVKFGLVSPDVHLRRENRNLSGQGSFLGGCGPTGY